MRESNLETCEEMKFATLPLDLAKLKSLSISDIEFTSSHKYTFIENPEKEIQKALSQ